MEAGGNSSHEKHKLDRNSGLGKSSNFAQPVMMPNKVNLKSSATGGAGSNTAVSTAPTFHNLQNFQSMLKAQQKQQQQQQMVKKVNRNSMNGESPNRQLLPVVVCLITFATVLSVLIIYMDTTEIRHQQFRLNMSRDYDLLGVSQDNPTLVTYVREVFMRRYADTPYFARPQTEGAAVDDPNDSNEWEFRGKQELTPRMAQFVVDNLLGGKQRGVFVQSMTGANDALMTAPWLVGGAQWSGVIVEPEPRKYFNYRKQNGAQKGVDVVHACVSPNEYPKEVTLKAEEEEESEVKINSVLGEDEDSEAWFHSRVKCFPLYTIMLATNRTKVDLLSLGCHGQHLQILQTIPFDRVQVQLVSLHFAYAEDKSGLVGSITRFLYGKGFEFVRRMEHNYFYQAIATDAELERAREEMQEEQGGQGVAL